MKIPKMTTFSQNVTDRSDTQKSAHFREKTVKKCQFLHFPLGLDKGLGHSCPLCPCVVSECVSGVKNSHFLQKPLGLDRVFRQKVQNQSKTTNFSQKTTICQNCHFPLV